MKIIYKGEVNGKLDEDLEKVLKKHGYSRWASGYTFETDERDLAFEKKNATKEIKR